MGAAKDFKIDSRQLELLGEELAALPQDLNNAVRGTLQSGINFSLKKIVSKHYAINPGKLAGTYRVRTFSQHQDGNNGLRFEVVGRRLTLAHFNVSPFRMGAPSPMIEIVRGSIMPASQVIGADGKRKTPFVMSTGAKGGGKERLNIFRGTGVYFNGGKQTVRKFDSKGGGVAFNGRREKLISYRTVSVPQMLGHEAVAAEVQEELLNQFDGKLFKRIERLTGVVQQNIAKG